MIINKLLSRRSLRFIVIGVCNAIISFGILNLAFYKFHQTKIISSIIATSCALIFSFIMNRGFVFADRSKKARQQLPAFIAVTISGSLVVLNLVYILSLRLLRGHEHIFIDPVKTLTSVSLTKNFIDINISTIIGAIVAMFWNYNGYKTFVFKGKGEYAIEEAVEHTP